MAYAKCIARCDKPNIEFWADNCTAQNKNWTLYTLFVLLVNALWGPESITMKYLEKGHTFMSADAVHALIGKRMKHTETVLTFDDFVNLCSKAS